MSLLPYLEPGEGDETQNAYLALATPLRLFKTMAHAPQIALQATLMGRAILFESDLDPVLRELAILRAGWVVGNAYEIGHHERIGREVGMSEAQIEAARSGDRAGLGELEILAMDWAEQVVARHTVEGSLARRAIELLGHKQAVELSMTVGYYLMIAIYLESFRIPFEGADFKDGVKGVARPGS